MLIKKTKNYLPNQCLKEIFKTFLKYCGNILKIFLILRMFQEFVKNIPTEMRHFWNSENTSRIYRYILKVFSDFEMSENVSRKHQEYIKTFLKYFQIPKCLRICPENSKNFHLITVRSQCFCFKNTLRKVYRFMDKMLWHIFCGNCGYL